MTLGHSCTAFDYAMAQRDGSTVDLKEVSLWNYG